MSRTLYILGVLLLAGSAYHAGAYWWRHALQQPALSESGQIRPADGTRGVRVSAAHTGLPVQVTLAATVGR